MEYLYILYAIVVFRYYTILCYSILSHNYGIVEIIWDNNDNMGQNNRDVTILWDNRDYMGDDMEIID